jgi:hypothetical protein
MKLHQSTAGIFVPNGKPVAEALGRIAHLGIGAHQDDLEFMAFHGILNCFGSRQNCFGGVICTNGSGSARTGPYADFSDAEMMAVRRREQNAAALIGGYGVMLQLVFGMDLTPLVENETADIVDYTCEFIARFQADVREKLARRLGRT